MEDFEEAVLDFCKKWIGTKEIGSNDDFADPKFRRLMDLAGWEKDQAWCAYLGELAWTVPIYSGKSKVLASMLDCFSANAYRTMENFDNNPKFTVSDTPTKASLGIMVRYDHNKKPKMIDVWTLGHLVVVEDYDLEKREVYTIEGNTNSAGSREGDTVAKKTRKLNFEPVSNGLAFVGFIKPANGVL